MDITAIALFLAAAIQAGTPLLLATLGESLSEKVGNLNLGVEGIMLVGAISGFAVAFETGNTSLAILAAFGAGLLMSLIYGILTITLRTNQIVTGLALTIFGTGVTSYIGSAYMGDRLPQTVVNLLQRTTPIPLLSKIPFLGDMIFNQDIMVYMSIVIAILLYIYINKTKYGLNMRAVGENPYAADAAGIDVSLYKYIHVLAGGGLCGLAGGYLSLSYIPVWQDNVVAGRGWIAVALVIFVAWNPIRAIFGAYLFGILNIIGFRLQKYEIKVPQDFIDMLPYIVTILVLIISSMKPSIKNKSPKWLGVEFFREDR